MKTQAIFNCFVGARGAAAGGYAVSIGRDCLVGREDLWDSGAAAGGFQSGFRLGSESFSRGGHVCAFTYDYVKSHPEHPAPHDLLSSGGNEVCFATTPPDMEASCKTKKQSGYATQHLQPAFRSFGAGRYLPFGESWIDQQSGSFDTRYKFSAKELDDETQYSYFGARYYDSDLSVWLSVDNFAALAPNCSPYSYVFGNPVCLTDPDGNFPGDGDKVHVKSNRKVKRQNSPPTNRNRAGQKYGSGAGYRATDVYNAVTGDNAAHKVRAGHYETSPWTQVPQTGQNGNWTSHRFSGPQYNPNDYRLRNVSLRANSNNPLNAYLLFGEGLLPINFGAGVTAPSGPGNFGYQANGAISPLYGQVWRTLVISLFSPLISMGPMALIQIIPASIVGQMINMSAVDFMHRNDNDFRAWTGNVGGTTSHTVWIKYRIWQGGAAGGFVNQLLRRILYGFGGNR